MEVPKHEFMGDNESDNMNRADRVICKLQYGIRGSNP